MHLGCGSVVKPGFVNIDRLKYPGVVICNLGIEPLPYGDNSVEYVFSNHFFEHLGTQEINCLLDELYRVCRNGSVIDIVVPHHLSNSAYRVWHKQFFSEGFFNDYLVDRNGSSLDNKNYFRISFHVSYQRYRWWLPIPIPCNIFFKLVVVK